MIVGVCEGIELFGNQICECYEKGHRLRRALYILSSTSLQSYSLSSKPFVCLKFRYSRSIRLQNLLRYEKRVHVRGWSAGLVICERLICGQEQLDDAIYEGSLLYSRKACSLLKSHVAHFIIISDVPGTCLALRLNFLFNNCSKFLRTCFEFLVCTWFSCFLYPDRNEARARAINVGRLTLNVKH